MDTKELNTLKDNVMQEIRRGVLELAVLSELRDEKYGYSLINSLAEKGLSVDQGTLYPLLRRLETHGLLNSEWNVEGARPRRYYVLSPAGREALVLLTAEWRELTGAMDKLLNEAGPTQGTEKETI